MKLCTLYLALVLSTSCSAASWSLPGLCPGYILALDKTAARTPDLVITNGPTLTAAGKPVLHGTTVIPDHCAASARIKTTWVTFTLKNMCYNKKFVATSINGNLAITCTK